MVGLRRSATLVICALETLFGLLRLFTYLLAHRTDRQTDRHRCVRSRDIERERVTDDLLSSVIRWRLTYLHGIGGGRCCCCRRRRVDAIRREVVRDDAVMCFRRSSDEGRVSIAWSVVSGQRSLTATEQLLLASFIYIYSHPQRTPCSAVTRPTTASLRRPL